MRMAAVWDRMRFPCPSRGGSPCSGPPIAVARTEAEAALPAIAEALKRRCDQADRWWRVMAAGLAALLWRCSARAAAPLLPLLLRRRVRRGKEVPERLAERYGRGAARPPGRLIWVHAASNGETLSVLPVIEAMAAMEPGLGILVTTGTVTSAALLARSACRWSWRGRAAPLRAARRAALGGALPRWLAPGCAVFCGSELWPNLIGAAAARGIPMGLVNGRMSARSARWWGRAPGLARRLLGGFRICWPRAKRMRRGSARWGRRPNAGAT